MGSTTEGYTNTATKVVSEISTTEDASIYTPTMRSSTESYSTTDLTTEPSTNGDATVYTSAMETSTTETMIILSFYGEFRITSETFTDSLLDSSNSDYISKADTYGAMVCTFNVSFSPLSKYDINFVVK